LRLEPSSEATEKLANLIFPFGGRTERDPARAHELLCDAEAAGLSEASELLAQLYLSGEGCERDYERAKSSLERAAADGRASGDFGLGDIYFRGLGVDADPSRAADHYEKAADKDHARAKDRPCDDLL
jgi:TPR repeat protein